MKGNEAFEILIVDDERFNIEVVVGFLETEGYKLAYATNGKEALRAAFSKPFDLILLDINMPELDGFEVCRRLKNDPSTQEIPIIFLSALNDIATVTKAFSVGAVDYLSKPFNGLELMARVRTQIDLRRYILELKEKQNRLAHLASIDQMTGLANKLRFMSVAKKSCAAATSLPSRLALAYVRLDHLSHINTVYGYKAGDKAMIKVAKVLQGLLRPKEIAARLFGSEFVVLMPESSLEAALYRMQGVLQQIRELQIAEVTLSVSIGVVEYQPNEGYEAFVLRAEQMVDEARRTGGNAMVHKISKF